MIKYHYNKEKNVIVAYFCDEVTGNFGGREYWFHHISNSLCKVFSNKLIDNFTFDDFVSDAVDNIQFVTKVKVTKDCDVELAKKIAKDRLILKWTNLEFNLTCAISKYIHKQVNVMEHRVEGKLKKSIKKIDRLESYNKK